jgi:hypothetical protein
MQTLRADTQSRESWVLNHADRTVETKDGCYGKRGNGRPGPYERWFALNVQHDDFVANGEVHADADGLFPSVAVEMIIAQASDDAI